MFFIIYKTTNLINNKIYIGYHATKTPYNFDGYYGSGILLNRAIKKYGEENFKRETLYVFNTPEEALEKEKEIVNEDFIQRNDTYNIHTGGACANQWHHNETYREKQLKWLQSEERRKIISEIMKGRKHPWQDKINKNPEKIRKMAETHRGMKRSEESKKRMSEARKKSFANGLTVHNKIEMPPKEDLYFLLYEKKLMKKDVAIMMGITTVTLLKWTKHYGI